MSGSKKDYPFGNLLAGLREFAGLKQKDMVEKLKEYKRTLHENTYRNWESGNNLPSLRDVQEIAKILQIHGVDEKDTDRLFNVFLQTPPKLWSLPFNRNPLFTGRERILQIIFKRLVANHRVTLIQAINGLGGIGKTEIAVEYAYRNRDNYRTVLWANADSYNSLVSSYISLASQLNLPEKDAEKQDIIVEAVKQWLATHIQWMLIFDNADDVALTHDFLPSSSEAGHIILTTRSQALGPMAQSIEVDRMGTKAGVLFLLKRAKKVEPNAQFAQLQEADIADAKNVVDILGGLPLALDQAGAYIEETGCSIADYLDRYRLQRSKLLQRRNRLGAKEKQHPESVALTFSLAFERVKQRNQAAVKLLQFCAFLSPDTISEQLLLESLPNLDPELQTISTDPTVLDELIEILRAYSLIHRHAMTKIFSIHRLVQAVLRDEMESNEQHQWAERVVLAIERIFPDPEEVAAWSLCEQYLPHVQVCASLIEDGKMNIPEAARLINQGGSYLYQRGRYLEAKPLLERALMIREQQLGPTHPDTATSLNSLAGLYGHQGEYAKAEHLFQRALSIREKEFGPINLDTVTSLNNLAELYREQGKYAQAEPLLVRALTIVEQQSGPTHANTAIILKNLAELYRRQGKYAQAEPLLVRALTIVEQQSGPTHPDTATTINYLASLYRYQEKYIEAELLCQRALDIREQQLGPTHVHTGTSLSNLAELYRLQSKYTEAEPLYQRALIIYEQAFGNNHPWSATILNNLGLLNYEQGKYIEAEYFHQRALSIREQKLDSMHPDIAQSLHNLASLCRAQNKYAEAELLYQKTLLLLEQQLSLSHPWTTSVLRQYASFLRMMGRETEAEQQEARVLSHPPASKD